ncbi:hypothetical protein D3C76_1564910 [compost metagenome]
MKKAVIKLLITIALLVVLNYVQGHFLPLYIQDSAMLQVQDSDAAYAKFTTIQRINNWYWLAYVLVIMAIYAGDIKKIILGSKNKEDK